jgi:hypothetical protein
VPLRVQSQKRPPKKQAAATNSKAKANQRQRRPAEAGRYKFEDYFSDGCKELARGRR